MVETAAHLCDHVFPRLPVRQWVLSVPKRLRYFMQRDGPVLNMVLRIFLRVIAQTLQTHCTGAASGDKVSLHIGAVAFIHRFGSSLNEHVHFHVCVVDGVFEEVEGKVIFHPASSIDADTVIQAEATLRRRILRAFVGRGLLESFEAKEMLDYKHSGFSVDAGVCIEAHDRAGLERLLRYCARPPFAMERLRKAGSDLVYRCGKQHSEPRGDSIRGAKADELTLSPLELIERIAALVPPPRTHRHRYFGVLAPNSPLRDVVTAMAAAPSQRASVISRTGTGRHPDSFPERRRTLPYAARPCRCNPTRARSDARTAQTPSALPLGRVDRPHLRSVPSGLSHLRRADAHHRVHHPQRRYTSHPRLHRGGFR